MYVLVTDSQGCHGNLTWWKPLNHWMIVHLESGIAAAACEAHHVVLAIIDCDSRLIDGDVICPHIEDDTYFSLILQVKERKMQETIQMAK